jgi:hypothetical protein
MPGEETVATMLRAASSSATPAMAMASGALGAGVSLFRTQSKRKTK